MWDLLRVCPLGRLSRRSFFAGVAALLLAFFTATTISTGVAHAASDITWDSQGDAIYQSNTYAGPMSGTNLPSAVPSDSTAAYEYTPQTGTTMDIIYFPKGSDASTTTSADFITATYQNGTYSNIAAPKQLSVSPQTDQSKARDGSSACNVSGIGWIVCPVSEKLAEGMDYLFGVLTDFLKVAPLSGDTNGVIYRGWSLMRNFANVAFIIAFLIIVYSQITTYGISNYGIKKMLPRIIIAAILMNLSYWICAIGVDLSNVLAVSLESMFMDLYKSIMSGAGSASVPTWQGVTAGVLAGTAVAAGGVAILVTSGGVLALLIPALVGVALSALVAVIVLAARQALIVVLIIISPLAFVAFLLPNTEKYFHKWRELFMTMLLMFPIFAVLFGGAQLAGAAIMQSSHNIVTLLLGMTVQVVPVAITPFLLKFSGNLLNQLAGRVSGSHKGLVDRTRGWARGASERQMIRGGERGNRLGRRWMAFQDDRAKRDERYKGRRANLYGGSQRAIRHAEVMEAVQTEAKRLEAEHEIHLKARLDPRDVSFNQHALEQQLRLHDTTRKAEAVKNRAESLYNEAQAGDNSSISHLGNRNLDSLFSSIHDTSAVLAAESMRKQMAERAQQGDIAQRLKDNTYVMPDGQLIREYAGGILGVSGQNSALATAKKTASKHLVEDIENIKSTMDYDDAKDNTRLEGLFNSSTTLAQRVAYAQAMSKNGAPGIGKLKDVIQRYEASGVNHADLTDFKELVAIDGAIMSAGKDLEFWLTKSKDAAGNERSFTDISNDLSTWTNLSANAFAGQNAATHFHALDLLYFNDRPAYQRVVDMLRSNPAALAQVKQGVREKYTIFSDDEITSAGGRIPPAGTRT